MNRDRWATLVAAAMLTTTLLVVAAPVPAEAPGPASCDDDLRPTALSGPEDLISGECPGIRPGADISTPVGGCTMAFILTDGADLYGTTAGHCASVGQTIHLDDGPAIGTVIYSRGQPIGEDFAVFEIRDAVEDQVDPKMCAWGGPTGVFAGDGSRIVRHFGYGIGPGTLPPTRARSGALTYFNDAAFGFAGWAMPGDSGSPARLSSGQALGVITDLTTVRQPGNGPLLPEDPGMWTSAAAGTRLDHGISQAERATGLDLTLVTADLANEPLQDIAG